MPILIKVGMDFDLFSLAMLSFSIVLNYVFSICIFRETHPPSFKLDLFIRNLDRPADVVFERLGQ